MLVFPDPNPLHHPATYILDNSGQLATLTHNLALPPPRPNPHPPH